MLVRFFFKQRGRLDLYDIKLNVIYTKALSISVFLVSSDLYRLSNWAGEGVSFSLVV